MVSGAERMGEGAAAAGTLVSAHCHPTGSLRSIGEKEAQILEQLPDVHGADKRHLALGARVLTGYPNLKADNPAGAGPDARRQAAKALRMLVSV